MKPRLLNLFSALSVLLLIAVSQGAAQTPQRDNRPRTASVSGRVTEGGAPAVNALVMIAEVDPQSRGWGFGGESPQRAFIKVRTDNDGRYRVAGLAGGDYMIGALSKVYVGARREPEFNDYRSVTLDEGDSRDNVNLALVRGGVITGRVIDAEGRPLIESYLRLMDVNENGSLRARITETMRTDDRGVYRIYGLPAGRYVLSTGGDWASARMKRTYPETFYPDATDRNQAKIIEVKEGVELTDIDIRLGAGRNAYEVAGKVVDGETGQPLPQTALMCSKAGERGGKHIITDTEGRFRIGGLASGRYDLYLWRMDGRPLAGFGNDEYYSERTLFEVNNSDVSGLEVKAIRGSTISGAVIIEGDNDPAIKAKLHQMVVTIRNVDAVFDRYYAKIAGDGSFRFTGAAPMRATFYYDSALNEIFSIKRIERDGVEIRSAMEIKRGEQITGVRIIVAPANGAIRGQVEMVGAKLPEGGQFDIWVSPVRTTAGDEKAQAFYPKSGRAVADEKGRFLIERLAAGDYDLTCNAMVRSGQSGWSSAPGTRTVKQRVTVSGGAETTVKLTFDPARK